MELLKPILSRSSGAAAGKVVIGTGFTSDATSTVAIMQSLL